VGVHFTTGIASDHVDFCLVHETNDLYVIRGLGELHPCNCAIWNDTGSMARLCAPGNHLAFDLAD
jgi:hypothetical protein